MSFDPIDFLESAVQTPSHEDVTEMRDLLVTTLESAGVETEVDDAGNTLAVRDSGREGPHVVLNTHIDTVPPHIQFEREDDGEDDLIRGRGSCDAKGPLAAILAAFLGVEPARGRVTLAVTPDEETETAGARALSFDPEPDAVIVGEPTELDACNAAKGRFQAANQVPAECEVVVDRRSVPPETAEGFKDALADHLRGHAPEEVGVEVALAEWKMPFLEAFETPADAEVVEQLQDAVEQSGDAAGQSRDAAGGEVHPFEAATEASYFAEVAPTVVFGPGALADDEGPVAHSPREYVRTAEVERAADALGATLATLLR
jgi:acetylornithine deacetylase